MRLAFATALLFLFMVGCEEDCGPAETDDGAVEAPQDSTPTGDVDMPEDVTK
tara:strand:- start:2596 stop:2751 length:156 start_codon:yes stop_codon:yes gene_type:complete